MMLEIKGLITHIYTEYNQDASEVGIQFTHDWNISREDDMYKNLSSLVAVCLVR